MILIYRQYFRLEDQQEDCQNKYGCRVSFQDVEFISKIDRNVFDSLSQVLHTYIITTSF